MGKSMLEISNYNVPVFNVNTVVVGTGAAGYNAANRLVDNGQRDICIVTNNVNSGTSRNTGSDKQTYYKLTLAGSGADSVAEMAQTLFSGKAMDGSHALCEAALSAQCFFNLAELGVPFPKNCYGEYVGYKTDHDPRTRATSAGPYTSKYMTECLQAAAETRKITVLNSLQVVQILVAEKTVCGLICLNLNAKDEKSRFTAINCKNLVYATGGPAGMYANSVYPSGHFGATGIAFAAGVQGKNLTEWQYGLAAVKPKWNVSGTYMQALPRFISTNQDGSGELEFLRDFFKTEQEMQEKIFLKGYQWPFDVSKIAGGSSIIDILVYSETAKGRRVFLDFRNNHKHKPINFALLCDETKDYLEQAGACFGTPYQRLAHMNMPAASFFKEKGVDLATTPLEIALCAQHNNGGLDVDSWWQTNITGFFAVGEAAGTHGVYRPGGSALNSGQVGSLRAAQYIAACRQGEPASLCAFKQVLQNNLPKTAERAEKALAGSGETVHTALKKAAEKMSIAGGAFRDSAEINSAIKETEIAIENFSENVYAKSLQDLPLLYTLWDVLISQLVYLSAMQDFIAQGKASRGSALYTCKTGNKAHEEISDKFRFVLEDANAENVVQIAGYNSGKPEFSWRKVHGIPQKDDFFENVWRDYRKYDDAFFSSANGVLPHSK